MNDIKELFLYLIKIDNPKVDVLTKHVLDLPINDIDLFIRGELDLAYTTYKTLPDNLTINGDMILYCTHLYALPKNLHVKGNMIIYDYNMYTFENDLRVDGKIYVPRQCEEEYREIYPNLKYQISYERE